MTRTAAVGDRRQIVCEPRPRVSHCSPSPTTTSFWLTSRSYIPLRRCIDSKRITCQAVGKNVSRMDGADHLPVVPLTYTIAGSSEHSGRYAPQNIMVDRPADHTSRWSGGTRSTETVQWILLRLDSPAILS